MINSEVSSPTGKYLMQVIVDGLFLNDHKKEFCHSMITVKLLYQQNQVHPQIEATIAFLFATANVHDKDDVIGCIKSN